MRVPATSLAPLLAIGALLAGCTETRPTAPPEPAGAVLLRDDLPATRIFTTFEFPGSGGTLPLDVNPVGEIVGRYMIAGRTHGFHRDTSGAFTSIDVPGASFTVASGINVLGDIVGMYSLPSAPTVRHGFLLHDGEFTTIDPAGSVFTNPLGIDGHGTIVGRYCVKTVCRAPGSGDFHAFMYQDGAITTIDVPGAVETNAWKLAPRGDIVGGYGDVAGTSHLFLLRDGAYASLDLPDAPAIAQDNGGINARGDIVGVTCDAMPCGIAPTGTHGFLLERGRLTVFDLAGATATSALGINARGDIVGGWYDAAGHIRGFLSSEGDRE